MAPPKKRKVLTRGGQLVDPDKAPMAKPVEDDLTIMPAGRGGFFGSETIKKARPKRKKMKRGQ